MARKITRPIDETDYTVVVTCPQCKWRSLQDDKGRAWYVLARHLKAIHNDLEATRSARRNARHLGISSPLS